jgi:hypothetical protein
VWALEPIWMIWREGSIVDDHGSENFKSYKTNLATAGIRNPAVQPVAYAASTEASRLSRYYCEYKASHTNIDLFPS